MAVVNWVPTSGGSWATTSNWSTNAVPLSTDTPTFATDISAPASVTMDLNRTVTGLTFSDNSLLGQAWTIAQGSGGTLTLNAGTITTTTDATISAPIGGSGAQTKSGAAALSLTGGGAHSGNWAMNAGTLTFGGSSNFTGAGTITVSGSASPAATLNVTRSIANKTIVVNAGGVANISANTGLLDLSGSGTTFTGTGNSSPTSGTHYLGNTSTALNRIVVPTGRTISLTTTSPGITAFILAGNAADSKTIAVLDGGTLSTAANDSATCQIVLGYTDAASSFLHFKMKSGTVSYSGQFAIGHRTTSVRGAPSIADISGGTLTNDSNPSTFTMFGLSANGDSVYTVSNGVAWTIAGTSGNPGVLGFGYVGSAGRTAVLSVIGAGTSITGSVAPSRLNFGGGGSGSAATLQLNLYNGGLLTVGGISVNSPTGSNSIHINGGTLQCTSTLILTAGTVTTWLYGTSGTLASGVGGSIAQIGVLKQATGRGVSSIGLATFGEGYEAPPYVVITRGIGDTTGTGATAKADWDETTKQLTGITITNPGFGYTVAPTVTLSRGTGPVETTAATIGTVELTAADYAAGGFTKTIAGNINLIGTNEFTGAITISAGSVSIGDETTTGTLGLNDSAPVSVASGTQLNFNRTDTKEYSATAISGAGGIAKNGGTAGTYTLLSTAHTFTGPVAIGSKLYGTGASGALRVSHSSALGPTSVSAVTVTSGSSFELTGGITIPRPVSIAGTGFGSAGAIRNVSGNNEISGTFTSTASCTIASESAGSTLTFSDTNAAATGNAYVHTFTGAGDIDFSPCFPANTAAVTKTGTGTTILRGANAYTGVTTVSAGVLGYVSDVAPSTASNFGNASTAGSLLIAAGTGIRYYGTGAATFSRAMTFQGGAATANKLESNSSTGSVTHSTNAPTFATTNVAKTLQLGGSGGGANKIAYAITANGTGAISVTKADAGHWRLTNTLNTYTGATSVNAGTLGFEVGTWAANAKVTGTSTVTVATNAKIQTFSGTGASAQLGRHTYTALTFQNNSSIRIGG